MLSSPVSVFVYFLALVSIVGMGWSEPLRNRFVSPPAKVAAPSAAQSAPPVTDSDPLKSGTQAPPAAPKPRPSSILDPNHKTVLDR